MRLRQYIINEAIAMQYEEAEVAEVEKTLKKDCAPYLRILQKGEFPLVRGGFDNTDKYLIQKSGHVGSGRTPRDTPKYLHDLMNEIFKKKIGWDVRNGISTTPDPSQATAYGGLTLFFPIGKISWTWLIGETATGSIFDLYQYLNNRFRSVIDLIQHEKHYDFSSPEHQYWDRLRHTTVKGWKQEDFEKDPRFKEVINDIQFKTNQLWGNHRGEIMFNCKKYYMLVFKNMLQDDIWSLFRALGIRATGNVESHIETYAKTKRLGQYQKAMGK